MPVVDRLIESGVDILDPGTVFIGEEVQPERISGDNTVIYPGCRITGASTCILPGARLGTQGPVTADNCQIGPDVELAGGSFQEAVFLAKASAGPGSHVRPGTIFEEQAGIAHTVGLKQTILFPFVTLGSLINFCDILMAGGTSRKNHSEVGSSYIHFNFTPQQDKATASLLGDVPSGVMLRQPPIFLGGQGGLVGPCRIAFGTVIAAGCIWRKDQKKPSRLLYDAPSSRINIPFTPGVYGSIKRTVKNNIHYIANLFALRAWYVQVRSLFAETPLEIALHQGLVEKCDMAIDERIKRLGALADKMAFSIQTLLESGKNGESPLIVQKTQLMDHFFEARKQLMAAKDSTAQNRHESFLAFVNKSKDTHQGDYLQAIASLPDSAVRQGTAWLESIVNSTESQVYAVLPLFA